MSPLCRRLVQISMITLIMSMSWVALGQPTKAECVDAHSRGQDAKTQGKLALARKLFLTCAQASCPQLVANDCAKWVDEVARLQPTVTFAARDSSGTDLPDTALYIDEVLVAPRLDDGRPKDVDPGKHIVRFVHRGRDQTMTLVVGAGEQGRNIVATFGAASALGKGAGTGGAAVSGVSIPAPAASRPTGAKALMIGGAALALAGAGFGAYQLSRIPSNCSLSDHECAATPGDPVFDEAKRAVQLANVGWGFAGIGVAVAVGGAIWYFASSSGDSKEQVAVTPWVNASGGGLAFIGSL